MKKKSDAAKRFDFQNPPHIYGEVAFFWWHGDDITREKLSWILDQLKDKHICGLQINYCHGNSGGRQWGLTMKSDPKPFSDAWWELVKWFVGECGQYGISVSLSDYTLAAPGQEYFMDWVLEKHPEMIGQRLVKNDEGEIVIERVPYSISPMAKGFGEVYADEFYGAFERHLPGECGKGINFFFSDELQFNVRGNLWCDDFKEEFLKRKGYDITEKWDAIFEDIGPETPKIRLDYYDVIVQLSEERYFKPVYDWHEQRGMIFGCDHGGRGKDITEFGDYFRTMRWNQGPGNDQPKLGSRIVRSKVGVSIAHMYKRPRTWLEGFYSSGWDTGCADVADAIFRNFALGHNLLSLHGLYYSTHGSMWEWAPPCNHHHMPYWGQMGDLLGCTKRLGYLIANGVHCCDVAVLYPVAAAEADVENGKEASQTAFATATFLYQHGVDFDFIDFESIERAEVEDGKLLVSGEAFQTVVIPNMKAIRFAMMEKLRLFAECGGQVIFVGDLPSASDRIGREDAELDAIVNGILQTGCRVSTAEEVLDRMRRDHVCDFACGSPDPYFQHRRIEGKDYYIVYRVPQGTMLRLRAKGYPVLLDPWSGKRMRLDEYLCCVERARKGAEEVTVMPMPLTERELLIVMLEQDERKWQALPEYTPYTEQDTLIGMEGEWESRLLPTMDNTYGDWRLPIDGQWIGAEAREMEYVFSNSCTKAPIKGEWKRSLYGNGTYFWQAQGAQNEAALIAAEAPIEGMTPYRFSMRTGVQGDAGAQNSYHGLKGLISDEFLVMGEKKVKNAGSSSVYSGEGPYYFFTTVTVEQPMTVLAEAGTYKPDKIWIDHRETALGELRLEKGRHTVLLRFPEGGRSYFVLKKANGYAQTVPLAMKWYQNSDLLLFDAMPEQCGSYCWYRFNTPPGAVRMKVNTTHPVQAYMDGKALTEIGENLFELTATASAQVLLCAKQTAGQYDTAIFNDPVQFETGEGIYDCEKPFDEQGLEFYSGGICLKKKFCVKKDGKRQFFEIDPAIGCAASVLVNGESVATLLTPPYRVEITPYLCDGENEIEVRAFNTMHNHMKTIPTNFNSKIERPY